MFAFFQTTNAAESTEQGLEVAQQFMKDLITWSIDFAPRILGAIILLFIGSRIIKILMKAFEKGMEKRSMEPSLKGFLKSLLNGLLRVSLWITVIQILGVNATSLVAIIGAAGLAVGLALQGTLQNFAGGVIILLLKPFKTGQWIKAAGYSGVVKEIQIFTTHLKGWDGKLYIIPNGQLANSSLTNYSAEPVIRMDFTFGVAYGSDADKVKSVLRGIADADERILDDPGPVIVISNLGESSVDFAFRVWAKQGSDFWGAYMSINETVYKKFNEEGIQFPFPQLDVNVKNPTTNPVV